MKDSQNSTYEANRKIEETLEDGNLHQLSGKAQSTTDANIQLQEAFYNNEENSGDVPLYINNNTPAIKIK